MNDEEMLAALAKPFTGLHMETSLRQVTDRGRTLRRRRRTVPVVAAATTATMAAVAASMTNSGHQSATPTLAAWTVDRTSADTVTVTVRQFRDPQGLQRSLAAAGVPAIVQFGHVPCLYQAVPDNAARISQVVSRNTHKGSSVVFGIHPHAIPSGTRLDIAIPGSTDHSVGSRPSPGALPGAHDRGEHASAVRLIPAGNPTCGTPGPSPSRQ